MSERYYSAKDLAGLPGMPETDRHVRRIADSENWTSRPRPGKGGGKEYHESCLPSVTQRYLMAKRKVQAAKQAHKEAAKALPQSFYIMLDEEVFEVRKV